MIGFMIKRNFMDMNIQLKDLNLDQILNYWIDQDQVINVNC